MKLNLPTTHFFALCVLLLFSNCSKENKVKTNKDYLIGTWLMIDAIIDPPDFSTGSDLYATFNDCQQDNLYSFSGASKLIKNEGARKCNPATLQDTEGTFSWDSQETILSMTLDGKTTSYQILDLSETTMVKAERITFAGGERVITYTFSKQN